MRGCNCPLQSGMCSRQRRLVQLLWRAEVQGGGVENKIESVPELGCQGFWSRSNRASCSGSLELVRKCLRNALPVGNDEPSSCRIRRQKLRVLFLPDGPVEPTVDALIPARLS